MNIRTDMALELRELHPEQMEGVVSNTETEDGIEVTTIQITDQRGADAIGKPIGRYITIEAPSLSLRDNDTAKKVAQRLSRELIKLSDITKPNPMVLVVGLGNWNMTPDALGPKVIDRILVTRHIQKFLPQHFDPRLGLVCAVAPGVLGVTGMETAEVIRGIVDKVQPDLVIAIDSLASRRSQRISASVQLADTGITPGGGVGNTRAGITKETLGVPVIAIGVPTVVYASTIVRDALMQTYSDEQRAQDETAKLLAGAEDMVMTPKEIDTIIDDMAETLASGLNLALHRQAPPELVQDFLY